MACPQNNITLDCKLPTIPSTYRFQEHTEKFSGLCDVNSMGARPFIIMETNWTKPLWKWLITPYGGPCKNSVRPRSKSFFFPFLGDFYSIWGSVGTGAWAWTWTWTRAWQLFAIICTIITWATTIYPAGPSTHNLIYHISGWPSPDLDGPELDNLIIKGCMDFGCLSVFRA